MIEPASTSAEAASSKPNARALSLVVGGALLARLLLVDHAPSALDAATVVVALLAVTVFVLSRRDLDVRVEAVVLGAAVVVVGASVVGAVNTFVASRAAPTVLVPVVVALAVRVGGVAFRPFVLAALAAAGAIHASAALVQRFITWPDALARQDALALDRSVRDVLATLRPLGLSLSPDLMSGLVGVGLAATLALAPRFGIARALVVPVVVAELIAIATARSTTTLLGIGLVLLVSLVRLGRARLALGGAAVAIALFAGVGRGVERALHSLDERWRNWQSALEIVAAHPWLGVGPGGFAEAYESARIVGANETLYAHSWPLHLAAEVGVVGPLLVVAALALIARARWADPRPDPRVVVVEAGCLLLLLRSLVDFDAQVGQSAAAIGLAIGLVSPAPREARAASPARSARWVVVGLALVVAAITTPLVPSLTARENVLSAFTRGAAPTRDDVQALFDWTNDHPDDAIAVTLAGRIHVDLATACWPPGCTDARVAARAFLDAVVERPHHAAADLTSRARLSLLDGEKERAIAFASRAIERDRTDELAHAVRLAATSDEDPRRSVFLRALEETFTENVVRALRAQVEGIRAASTPPAADAGSAPEPVDE